MRKGMLLGAAGLGVALLAGCGGSSTPATNAVTRVLVGFVYVTKNDGGAYTGPSAFILPHNNLTVLTPAVGSPIPLDKPTAGIIELSVNGSITRAISTLDFDLSTSNEIICSAGGAASAPVTVTVTSPIYNGSVVKTLSTPTINLGTATGTVLGIQSPNTPTYTPGAPDSIIVRLNTTVGIGGVAANGPVLSPDQMMVSNGTGLGTGFEAGQVYTVAAAVLDKNGIVVTGAATTLTSSDPTRVLPAPAKLTAVAGQTAAAGITITTSVVGYTLVSATFQGPYNPGVVTTVGVTPVGPTDLLWAAAGPVATVGLTVTVANEVGSAMPGVTVNMTSNKETAPASNVWNTAPGGLGGAVFVANTGVTGVGGTLAITVDAPTSVGALAPGNPAKGHGNMIATAGAVSGMAVVNITRPLGSIVITGPTGLDVGTMSGDPTVVPLPATTIRVTGALDIDGDAVLSPAVVWAIVNTPAGGNLVGNTGDTSPRSVSLATIALNGRVSAGAIAGNATVTAAGGGVTSNTLTIDIYNKPSKLYYTPDTDATGGYTGGAGTTQSFALTFLDSYGHDMTAEVSGLTTASGISSSAAGQISSGGANVKNFTLTFGTSSGTFTITTVAGTWTGTHTNGGAGTPTDFSGLFRTDHVN